MVQRQHVFFTKKVFLAGEIAEIRSLLFLFKMKICLCALSFFQLLFIVL